MLAIFTFKSRNFLIQKVTIVTNDSRIICTERFSELLQFCSYLYIIFILYNKYVLILGNFQKLPLSEYDTVICHVCHVRDKKSFFSLLCARLFVILRRNMNHQ